MHCAVGIIHRLLFIYTAIIYNPNHDLPTLLSSTVQSSLIYSAITHSTIMPPTTPTSVHTQLMRKCIAPGNYGGHSQPRRIFLQGKPDLLMCDQVV